MAQGRRCRVFRQLERWPYVRICGRPFAGTTIVNGEETDACQECIDNIASSRTAAEAATAPFDVGFIDAHDRARRALLENDGWAGLEMHLAVCPVCRRLAGQIQRIDAVFAGEIPPPSPELLSAVRAATAEGRSACLYVKLVDAWTHAYRAGAAEIQVEMHDLNALLKLAQEAAAHRRDDLPDRKSPELDVWLDIVFGLSRASA